MPRFALIALAMLASLVVSPAFADDWVAQKLRGVVLELVDGSWQRIERGAVVPESHVVRTLGNGRVLFVRGSETVELGPDTQVAFHLRERDQFTTVQQYFGEVAVEADVRTVKHFAVQTPHLAAVVKGTIFIVRSDADSASVEVERGAVAVISREDRSSVTVRAGQEVSTSSNGPLEVSGEGQLPVVVDKFGAPAIETVAVEDEVKVKTNNGKSGDGNSGNGKPGKGKGDKNGKGNGQEDDED